LLIPTAKLTEISMTRRKDGHITLYLYGDELNPEEIEKITLVKSKRSWKKGFLKSGKYPAKTGLFAFEDIELNFNEDIIIGLRTLSEKILKHFPLTQLPGVSSVNFDIYMDVEYQSERPITTLLSSEAIALMAAAGASFCATYYDSTDD
jgi:hypothetical protein